MSNVVELLRQQAQDIRSVAAPQASSEQEWAQVKSAAVHALVLGGMSKDKAEGILSGLEKEAGFGDEKPEEIVDLLHVADVLEKTAAYIEEVEVKLAESCIKIDSMKAELSKSAEERDSGLISSLKDKGFSDSEIANLRSLPKETIEKIAHVNEPAWDLGEASGKARGQDLDAISAFCLS